MKGRSMTKEAAEFLVRGKHEWPIWLFGYLVYFIPAVYMAFTGGPLFMVVWGLLAGLGCFYFLEAPFRAARLLRKEHAHSDRQ